MSAWKWLRDEWLRRLIGNKKEEEPEVPPRPLPTCAPEMVGWGPTYCWMDTSPEDMERIAEAMAAAA